MVLTSPPTILGVAHLGLVCNNARGTQMEKEPFQDYRQLTDQEMEIWLTAGQETCEEETEYESQTEGWWVCVRKVPGIGYVTDGADRISNWGDPLVCPPGVTTAAQVAAEQYAYHKSLISE